MSIKFVTTKDWEYKAAIQLRSQAFFENMSNALDLINDSFENDSSWFVVFLQDRHIVATGRLHLRNNAAVISQMAVGNKN